MSVVVTRAVVPWMLGAGTGSEVNVATAAQLAASTGDDGTNVNGAILASDGDWSAL